MGARGGSPVERARYRTIRRKRQRVCWLKFTLRWLAARWEIRFRSAHQVAGSTIHFSLSHPPPPHCWAAGKVANPYASAIVFFHWLELSKLSIFCWPCCWLYIHTALYPFDRGLPYSIYISFIAPHPRLSDSDTRTKKNSKKGKEKTVEIWEKRKKEK
jgi:hypothetical protein